MSFILPDLVIESVLREGFADIQANPEKIDDILSVLTKSYLSTKYGQAELAKIKTELETDISFIHSFPEAESRMPSVSIQLIQDSESKKHTFLDDAYDFVEETLTDPGDLAALEVISNLLPVAFNPTTDAILVDDSVDLTPVYANLIFEDADGTEFTIIGGIDNTPGQKQFVINATSIPNVSTFCVVKSSLNYTSTEVRGVISDVQILLGIHTKKALMTKYLYNIIKYFLISRKDDLVNRCFINLVYSGSDFTRNMEYAADRVYTRFLTITGRVEDSWDVGTVDQIDNIQTTILVDRDVADAATLGIEDNTVQPKP